MAVTHAAGPFAGTTLSTVAARLRDGLDDPIELTRRSLAAIEDSQPTINAFVTVDAPGALRAAAVAARELADGVDRGPLHGIPVAVKDIVDTAELLTTMGSRHFADNVPAGDAEVVTRLRTGGAIIVGKTTTHQFAYGPTGDRAANGACANPHDPSRMAGGSSAGSAAAVAAGLVALAVGTDTGGSVRIPAALCGCTGIRPSTGRVPVDGVFPLSWTLDTVGVLAADVDATAIGWQILTGAGANPAPELATLRIGIPAGFDRLDEPVQAGLDAVRQRLAARGAAIIPVSLPALGELRDVYRIVQSVEAVSIHHDRMVAAPEKFEPEVLQRLRAAADVSARDYAYALRRLTEVRAGASMYLADVDVLLLATVPVVAPPLGIRDAPIGGGWTSPRDALLAHTTPFSVLGLPSMSLPIPGLPVGSLPVGVQLVGTPFADEALLAAARTIEHAIRP